MTDVDLAALAKAALTVATREDILELRAKFFDGPFDSGSAFGGAETFEELDALMGAFTRISDARGRMIDAEILIENVARNGGSPADFLTILDDAASRATEALTLGGESTFERQDDALGTKGLRRLVPGFLRRAVWEKKPALTTERGSIAAAAGTGPSFQLSAKDGGRTRWLMVVGHNGRDREGEIFPQAGLELNVKAIQQTGIFPEAWIGHEPGSRWGLADFVDVLDGVYVASGLVDDNPTAAAVAVQLAAKADELGVSHAYAIVEQVGDEIRSFFDYEISVLPRARAALPETGALIVGAKEAAMDPKKREEIEGMLGKDLSDGLFAGVDTVNGLVAAAGLDRKDLAPEPTPEEAAVAAAADALAVAEKARDDAAAAHKTPTGEAPPAEPPPAPPTEPTPAAAAAPVANAAAIPPVTTGEKSADEQLDERIQKVVVATMTPFAEAMQEMGLGIKQLMETDESKTAARIKNAGPAYVASKDAGNIEAGVAGSGPGREPVSEGEQTMADWMTDGIFGKDAEKAAEPVTN
jgi:hypothetical protein